MGNKNYYLYKKKFERRKRITIVHNNINVKECINSHSYDKLLLNSILVIG